MKKIKEFVINNVIITDGASGTYISSLAGRNAQPCELLNLNNPELVFQMHEQYIKAGANLIFTNTFGASIAGNSIGSSFLTTSKIITEGIKLAKRAAGETAFAAGDIGPLPETAADSEVLENEYHRIVDTFLKNGIDIFVFETFPSSTYPISLARYIKSRNPKAFIITSFAVMPDGYTREGIAGRQLIEDAAKSGCVDAAGFNCCSGPVHLLNYAKTVNYGGLIPVIMPNAGYPQRESNDVPPAEAGLTYSGTPEYFGEQLSKASCNGFRIIGGCCGTTPRHIEMLAKSMGNTAVSPSPSAVTIKKEEHLSAHFNSFKYALEQNSRKIIVAELDPPFNSDCTKLTAAAHTLKAIGVDAVTVADSPMARPRADSVTVAAKLMREAGVEAIPHICCRDKNINAIKSAIIAAHIEGIRNILAVTGDPVPDTDRGTVKSVFNLNSVGLCRFIQSLDSDIFNGDEISCGCAFNVNVKNISVEIERLKKKISAGATFTLTQPVFTNESLNALKEARAAGIKVIAGILTPISYKNIKFLANEMPGFTIPEEYINRFTPEMTREEGEKIGIAISAEIAEKVSPFADGFYFIIPFNRVNVIEKLIEILKAKGIL